MPKFKFLFTLIILIHITQTFIIAKEKIKDERRFQLGFGFVIGSHNYLGLRESQKMIQAIDNGNDYDYPGLSKKEKEAFNNLDGGMKRAIVVANLLGAFEYGLQTRILWRILLAEIDLIILPFDSAYNGRVDLVISPMLGIRAPLAIMPYLIGGIIFTFSFYQNNFSTKEKWKSSWAHTDNFVFRPGLNIKAGIDFKIPAYLKVPKFSIGAYYQYTIKDFEEFSGWYNQFIDNGSTTWEAATNILSAQSRVGISLCFYLF